MKLGGGGGPEGGGPGCCTEVQGVSGVQGGGGPEAYTTLHKHATCIGGGGACWPLTNPSTAKHQGLDPDPDRDAAKNAGSGSV